MTHACFIFSVGWRCFHWHPFWVSILVAYDETCWSLSIESLRVARLLEAWWALTARKLTSSGVIYQRLSHWTTSQPYPTVLPEYPTWILVDSIHSPSFSHDPRNFKSTTAVPPSLREGLEEASCIILGASSPQEGKEAGLSLSSSASSLDWIKGKSTGNPNIWWWKSWFPVSCRFSLPFNQSIDIIIIITTTTIIIIIIIINNMRTGSEWMQATSLVWEL